MPIVVCVCFFLQDIDNGPAGENGNIHTLAHMTHHVLDPQKNLPWIFTFEGLGNLYHEPLFGNHEYRGIDRDYTFNI